MTITIPPENVIAIQTEVGFERTVDSLLVELPRHEFRILRKVDFSRELDSLSWINHFALRRFDCLASILRLSDAAQQSQRGLMIPFNFAVYQKGNATTVSVLAQPSLIPDASLGIRSIGQELNRRIRQVMLQLGARKRPNNHREMGSRNTDQGLWPC